METTQTQNIAQGNQSGCHNTDTAFTRNQQKWIALAGFPNVGKSLLFNRLSGSRVSVSNYPGTTVAVDQGTFETTDTKFDLVDLPGMYSLSPVSEEERIAKNALIKDSPDIILHVIDAKNIRRMLPMTLELIQTGLPVILVANMMDEAQKSGITIDFNILQNELNIPVIPVTARTGKGIEELIQTINVQKYNWNERTANPIALPDYITQISSKLLSENYPVSKISIAQLLLENDPDTVEMVKAQEADQWDNIHSVLQNVQKQYKPVSYAIKKHYLYQANKILSVTKSIESTQKTPLREKISRILIHPVTGIPVIFLVLYFVIYKFVGVFGAGTMVDYIEGTLFGEHINPALTRWVENIIPIQSLQQLFVGEYGVITLGLTYAVAIILPVVGTFFLAFSVIEDTGYLPRLALLLDRIFKKIGLSGKAVIPMVLGLGCATMATVVTRTQETKRERVISTLLLALAVPCSAQLGVILALLSPFPKALLIWGIVIGINFLFIGFLSSKILPGKQPAFYMELPPLRLPQVSNILTKTYTRIIWYLREVFPLFMIASIIIWILQISGVFEIILGGLEPVVNSIGLPDDTSKVFLFGFFRRDYGAAGLYDIQSALAIRQIVTAAVVLTLFVPCIAQFMVMIKERGIFTAVGIFSFVLIFAVTVGFILNTLLVSFNIV